MSKTVFVSTREIDGDNIHRGFVEFEGAYKTLTLAQSNWWPRLVWAEDKAGSTYDCERSRWTARIKKGVTAVIEEYEIIAD